MLVWVLLGLCGLTWADCCLPGAVYNERSQRCYTYHATALSFVAAEQQCVAAGGHLTAINTGYDNSLIAGKASAFAANVWIGATNNASQEIWRWTDNTVVVFANWKRGQPYSPAGECVSMATASGEWSVADCSSALPFLCSVASVSNTVTTTVPYETTTETPSVNSSGHCEPSWSYFEHTDSCYKHYNLGAANFSAAEERCAAEGAHQASIHNIFEDYFVQGLIALGQSRTYPRFHFRHARLGLLYDGHKWQWTDGSDLDYIAYGFSSVPDAFRDHACVHLWTDDPTGLKPEWRWQPHSCDTNTDYVCKKPAGQ